MLISAVLTGDIVASTLLSKADLKKLMKDLQTILSPYQYEFFRGDSFQAYIKAPDEALRLLVQARASAIKIRPEAAVPINDIRACIGIGQVKAPVKALQTATDEAFVLSGRTFDKMKAPQRLLMVGPEKNTVANLALDVIGNYIDFIFRRMTAKQADVVFELLQNRTQTETAKRLKKSQATINKHAQAAGWPELEKLLTDYSQLVGTLKL